MSQVPIVDRWFTDEGGAPALLGNRCTACGTVFFPKATYSCRNPNCSGRELEETRLSSVGTIWSYTDTRYQPPPPFEPVTDPFEPFCLAAVELADDAIVVLGQMVAGVTVDDLAVGMPVTLVVDALDDDHSGVEVAPPVSQQGDDVVVLGAGMHEWGKWGRNFIEYGIDAAEAALADADVAWPDVQFVAGADTIRNGYPGFIAGASVAQALGWTGVRVASCYAACASGAAALSIARDRIRAGAADLALVVGADTTPKGFFAPVGGDRPDDPDWLRFRVLGATNPAYFALYARRRMALYGATEVDFATVKAKNARHGLANPNARYRKAVTVDEVLASPVVASPLHLLDICATSDGAAAVVLASAAFARRHGTGGRPAVRVRAVSTVTPVYPNSVIEMPNFATDSAAVVAPPPATFRDSIAAAAYEEAGLGPDDLSLAEVYDLSTALELDWYENIGLCSPGEAEGLLHDGVTTIGGRVPVNPSGGLACFGEAIPAQALAQVCEVTWQLQGRAAGRQVDGARVGLTVNQGLFGHGSSVILST